MKIFIETHTDTEPRIVTIRPGQGSEKSKINEIKGNSGVTPKKDQPRVAPYEKTNDSIIDNKWAVNSRIVYSDTLEGIRKKYSYRVNKEVTKGYRPIPHKKKGEGYYIYLQKKKG